MQELGLGTRFATALGAVPSDLRAGPIGLAVSGGSDSRALLHLAHDWASASGARLAVFTVDHGLRAASASEAEDVAAICRELGRPHRTLKWAAPVPRQPAARRARHALLAEALRREGGTLLLTGHTVDDQAETVLMRIRQGSGWYGLAGMRALSLSPVWPEGKGIWIARPLLAERRADLRRALERAGREWTDDPSNENTAFERVRMRRRLSASPHELTARVLDCQRRAAQLRASEDAALADWLGRDVTLLPDGQVQTRLDRLSDERAARALGVLIQCIGGRETPPRSASLAALVARLRDAPGFGGATLGSVRLRPGREGLTLRPEAARPGKPAETPDLAARVSAFQRLFINSAQEIAAGSGKESFLQEMEPIFMS